jgi:DNA (cytosine-5)-methyltransferase 1
LKKRQNYEAGTDTQAKVQQALDSSLLRAEDVFKLGFPPVFTLSDRFKGAIENLSGLSEKASTGFTNIVTCLAIKVAKPEADIRYHQVQIQDRTQRPAGFNFRGLSEKVVYPWLDAHTFEGAKSGWQTRTFEPPKPYMMDYDENIGDIKTPFLTAFDEIEEHGADAGAGLAYLIYLQLVRRENKNILLSVPKANDILFIVSIFRKHFFHKYKASKGASRLPVLALHAIYSVMVEELERFHGKVLKPLQEHSAADSQTGSVGDIEVVDIATNTVFEALEIKHDVPLSVKIIQDVQQKIMDKAIDRYYILTTHVHCEPDEEIAKKISNLKALYSCQIIANGVMPSIKYYLRLLSDPSKIFPKYVALLQSDKAVAHEHREVWNKIAIEL